jgi:glucose-6-phosphate dehydrogenase assembly protein OpcA
MLDTRPHLPHATEPLTTRWDTSTIEVERVRDELATLWVEWAYRYGESAAIVTGDTREQVYMRPSTMNVIAVTDGEEPAARIGDVLGSLPDYSPTRSIVLARSDRGSRFGVRIEINERRVLKSSSPVYIEVITLTGPAGSDEILASISTPLRVPDLPDVLFVPGEPIAGNALVEGLLDRVDGLLVDTVTSRNVGDTLAFLTRAASLRLRMGIGDLVWTRLRTWRDLVAQFFDQPSALACLDLLDEARIVYAPPDGNGRSGLTAGLLMAGWLASRLGWRAPGELIPTSGGHRLTLRAGERGRSREVLLYLLEGTSTLSCSSLESVRLSSSGREPCVFSVERTDEAAITTFSSSQHVADMTRLVHSSCPADRVILAAKLRRLRVDTVYLEALEVASTLWPEGFET